MRFILALILFWPVALVAQEIVVPPQPVAEPETLEQAADLIPTLIRAVQNGEWLLFGAILTLILTFVVRKHVLPKTPIGDGVLPIVSAVIGLIAGLGLAIANGAGQDAALLAVLSGPLACTAWSAVVKYFFQKA